MGDLLDHLQQPLVEGGHGHDPQGYVIAHMDWDDVHTTDHDPDAWWRDAIIHTPDQELRYG